MGCVPIIVRGYNIKHSFKQNYYGLIWGLVIAAIITLLFITGAFDRLEKLSYDWRIRHNTLKKNADVPKIAIIGISDEDMKLLGRWPWPRSRYAETLDYLKEGGASVVAFDMFFDLPDMENPKNDKILSDAAKDAGMVIFPIWSPTSNLFGVKPVDGLYKGRLNENIEIIAEAAEGIGHLNVFYDNDGVARRTPIQIADSDGRKRFVPLSLAIFLKLKGINREMVLYPGNSLKIGNFNIPLDSKSCIPINYINFEKQIHIHQSANIKWLEKIGQEKPITLYSFSDVSPGNENRVPAAKFKDKLVLIGIATPGSEQDVHVTPFGRKFGVFIQANLLYNFLTERLISIPENLVTILIFAGLSVIFGILIFRLRIRGSTYLLLAGGLLVLSAISAIIAFTGLILFQKLNIMIDMIPFITMFLMLIGTCLAVNLSSASGESAMRDLQLNFLVKMGEITTSKRRTEENPDEDANISSAISNQSEPMLELIKPIEEIIQCEMVALYIKDDIAKDFKYTASTATDEKKDDLQRISSVANNWFHAGVKPVWIDNISKHPELSLLNTSIRCFLGIPLVVKEQTIGILYLCNKLPSKFSPFPGFTSEELRLLTSSSYQIAIAVENYKLYQNIQKLFDGFVKASVHAIEQRDPTTSGHSERVATMTVGLAELVDKLTTTKYKDVYFSKDQLKEMKYAGLLHDFGKVGVRENVLVKANKLYPGNTELIKSRFDFIKRSVECRYHKKKINLLCSNKLDNYEKIFSEIDKELREKIMELDNYFKEILEADKPTILHDEISKGIIEIARKTYLDYDGKEQPYITTKELNLLSIMKGTLNEKERLEIESHVTKSHEFLMKIPWTKDLELVPNIAYAHHEKLDGTGYPLKLKKAEIPVQSKMMTIVDIFDALTASDRPYKKAMSCERALDIISYEVKGHLVDPDLFNVFADGKVYELI